MTYEETMYVKKLGVYCGVTVYALYPSQSTLEDSRGANLRYYVNNLAEWLAKGILSSQFLSKTLISAEPLLSPEIKHGTGQREWTCLLPARILDDLIICRARAYYVAHPEQYKPRRIPDMEDSKRRGEEFVGKYLLPKLENLKRCGSLNRIMKLEDCNKEDKKYYIIYSGLKREITCKPDAVIILLLKGKILRTIVVEVADTDAKIILEKKHVIPRILLYMLATYLHYGVPSVGLYISLSPVSSPPVIMFLLKKRSKKITIIKYLEEVKRVLQSEEVPSPAKKPICSHCVYASICKFKV